MLQQLHTPRCSNCGTAWTPASASLTANHAGSSACPVCGFREGPEDHTRATHSLTAATLETELMDLVSEARASGIALDEIVEMLRRELAFNTEMAHTGHHCLVQVIDLGEVESGLQPAPRPERLQVLYGEGFSG